MAALLDAPARTDYERRVEQAESEIDNLRAAFGWSLENGDVERALELASSLQPLWLTRGRIREGLAWFDAALTDRRRKSPRGGGCGARAGARRQSGARRVGGGQASAWIRPSRPWRSRARSTTRPCWRAR